MEVLLENVPFEGTVVALGNFDGLHIAHMTIIRDGIDYARKNSLKSGILLFDVNTKGVTQGGVELITPNEAKLELLEREDPDFVFVKRFDREFMQKTPEDFARYLVDTLHAKVVCCGYDYSFGYRAGGDVELLKKFGSELGFEVRITDVIKIGERIVSSTYIRQLINSGEMERAEQFLGRRYCVQGKVIRGFQNGTRMGIPTANVDYDPNMAFPKEGVYAGITYVRGRRLKSVINVGRNLTFGAEKATIESHILDFNEDIYGEYIRVSFAKRLRGVIKFDSVDDLIQQIKYDMQITAQMDL